MITGTDESLERINTAMIHYAGQVAREIEASAILVYVDVIKSHESLKNLINETRCILAARDEKVIEELRRMKGEEDQVLRVPYIELSRFSQVKVAAILALTGGMIAPGERLVCLFGSPPYGILDSLMVMDVAREFELFTARGFDISSQMALPHVFHRLLTIALELAEEGKEGKPLGTIFVFGDHEKVMDLSSQMVINPFGGVSEHERSIMLPEMKETIREFAAIDGAFVIREDGVILAAGRHLKGSAEETDLPRGLGARHRAALGITALTNALAIAISESTGDVRLFTRGKVFIEIEKRRCQRRSVN